MWRSLLLTVILTIPATGAGQSQAVYVSPDRAVRAVVTSVGPRGAESRIDLVSASGALVARKAFASSDGEHGFGAVHAEWTLDGRYFVISLESSGGHQPWHCPTYVYSRRSRSFYALDDYVGAVTSDFRIVGAGRIAVSRQRAVGDGTEERVTFALSRLEAVHLNSRPN